MKRSKNGEFARMAYGCVRQAEKKAGFSEKKQEKTFTLLSPIYPPTYAWDTQVWSCFTCVRQP
jgi:hypothetical protein